MSSACPWERRAQLYDTSDFEPRETGGSHSARQELHPKAAFSYDSFLERTPRPAHVGSWVLQFSWPGNRPSSLYLHQDQVQILFVVNRNPRSRTSSQEQSSGCRCKCQRAGVASACWRGHGEGRSEETVSRTIPSAHGLLVPRGEGRSASFPAGPLSGAGPACPSSRSLLSFRRFFPRRND